MAAGKLPESEKELEELEKKVKSLNRAYKNLNQSQLKTADQTVQQVEALKNAGAVYDQLIQQTKIRQADILASSLPQSVIDAELERMDKKIERLERTKTAAEAATLALKEEAKESVKRQVQEKRAADEAAVASETATERVERASKRKASSLATWIAEAVHGSKEGVQEMVKTAGPELAVLSAIFPKLGPGELIANMKTELKGMDANLRSVAKETGLFSDEIKGITIGMGDIGAEARQMEATIGKPFQDIGILSENSSRSMKALLADASTFNARFMEANPIVTKFTGNFVAGMAMIGVSERASVKAITGFNKVLGQTPEIAIKTTKQLTAVAHSLGVSIGDAIKDFNALMPNLAMWGNRVVDVFADLQAQSVATGLSVQTLNDAAGKWDTFEGAADAAQRFNTVLGGTYVSITELVQAEPAEKINLLRDAMARAGVTFTDSGRRMQQVITSALGLRDVGTAARIFGNEEDFALAEDNLDKTALTSDKLKKMILESKTSVELLHTSLSRLGGGFSKFVDRTRGYAIQGANAVTAGFTRAKSEVKDGEQAAIGMLGAFIAMDHVLGGATPAAKVLIDKALKSRQVAVAAGGGAAAWEVRQRTESGAAMPEGPGPAEAGAFERGSRHLAEARQYRNDLLKLKRQGEITEAKFVEIFSDFLQQQAKDIDRRAGSREAITIMNKIELDDKIIRSLERKIERDIQEEMR